MDQSTVTIICGTVLAMMNGYLAYRLKQQDNSRDAARAEAEQRAAMVKAEALSAARIVEAKVNDAAKEVEASIAEIRVMVNGRMSGALDRVAALEEKLGLSSGEQIPGPPTITTRTEPPERDDGPPPAGPAR